MKSFYVRNVSEALWVGMKDLEVSGQPVETRNGPAYEFSGPVATTYTHPRERVLFYPERDANPFFHCLESLWMLAGRNDVWFVSRYSNNIASFSDNGLSFHGAYGYRWRRHFDKDQLLIAAHRLKTYPNDRRTVVGMWDPQRDLMVGNDTRDVPCNTHIYFELRNGVLHMTVCNRSNDMIWGAYGANAVHMSYLLEYMAKRVGAQVGHYTQFSNNLHAYRDVMVKHKLVNPDYHSYAELTSAPLVEDPDAFDWEVKLFCDGDRKDIKEPFLVNTAIPMQDTWTLYKKGDYDAAEDMAQTIGSPDWRRACGEWLARRAAKRNH